MQYIAAIRSLLPGFLATCFALAMPGCHLIFTYQDREPDQGVVALDGTPPDVRRPPDSARPLDMHQPPDSTRSLDKGALADLVVLPPDSGSAGTGALSPLWARRFGGNGMDEGLAVAAGSSGICLVGSFTSSADMGSGRTVTAAATDSRDAVTAMIDSSGKTVWAKSSGSAANVDYAQGVATDSSGSCLVTGAFRGTATFAPGKTLTSKGITDVFLTRRTASNGTLNLLKQVGSDDQDFPGGVAVNSAGSILSTGSFRKSITVSSSTLTSLGQFDVFLLGYKPIGVPYLPRRFGGSEHDLSEGIAVDSKGNIYVVGSFQGSINFGGGISLSGNSYWDAFLVSYTAGGKPRWARKLGGAQGNDNALAVAVGPADNVYLTGNFSKTATFGNFTFKSSGDTDIFAASYSSLGKLVWATAHGGTDQDVGWGIAAHGKRLYIAGRFGSSVILLSLTAADGVTRWFDFYNGTGSDVVRDVTVDSTGHVYMVGNTTSKSLQIGATKLTSTGSSQDIFLAKFKPL